METTAKCVSMDHAHCRKRLSRRSAAAFQRGHKQDLVMEQEVSTLLRKEAIEVVPPLDEESGFYSRTSLFLGKGLRPFLDLSKLNHSVTRLKFRKLSSSTCLTPDPRTGGHEQSRRCILLPHHMKFLSLGAKCINIGFFPLALHSRPSSERMAVRQQDVILAHLKELGLRLNVRKVCVTSGAGPRAVGTERGRWSE